MLSLLVHWKIYVFLSLRYWLSGKPVQSSAYEKRVKPFVEGSQFLKSKKKSEKIRRKPSGFPPPMTNYVTLSSVAGSEIL